MKAIILNQNTCQLQIKQVETPKTSKNNVLIKLKTAAINHHELWSLKERSLKSGSQIIMGSDGAGVIEEVGEGVKNFKIGDETLINPSINWGTNNRVQSQDYEILGFPNQGTFAEYISIEEQYIYHKPSHLTFE